MAGELLPPILVPAVLYGALGVAVLRRHRRSLLVAAIVRPVVHLAASVPFLSASLSSPESPATFIPDTITVIAAVVTVVGAAMALLRPGADRRGTAMVAVGVGAVAAVASLRDRCAPSSIVSDGPESPRRAT